MKTVYRDPIGRLFDSRALPGLAKANMTSSNYDVDDDGFQGGRKEEENTANCHR